MTKHGTGISWTHAPGYKGETWNPVVGCTRVSAGCDHCFAFTLHDQRHRANRQVARTAWEYARIRPERFATPFEMICWARDARANMPFPAQYDRPFSQVQLLPDRLDQPLHWRKPRAVFVDSISDLFHEDVPVAFLTKVMVTAEKTPHHIYMILTKRPHRMHDFFEGMPPPDNVWLGVSIEDQAAADERIPLLLDTPAAVRFISAEPLLGPVDLRFDNISNLPDYPGDAFPPPRQGDWYRINDFEPEITWVIVGGESGPGWRPMEYKWAASIRDQCAAAGVAFYGKQDAGARSGIALPSPLNEQAWPEVT